ncbi:MAG: chemical-damaging agent resistance protein C [Micavibrio aeruginosavorus]|uniref:Chemical-damaging agent resistance protein C n=1 Tax=Micavibrio aeruginosavorus TaxID=349221 RepID=A0A2W5HQK8_9BACT|nr:MAG: chemical-damaging agent resistance protein C [Micavibrio aeruginosavorus]
MTEVNITTSAQVSHDAASGKEIKSFQLKRGEQVNLTRLDPTLKTILVGVGWDVIGFDGEAPDLDASIFLLDKTGKTRMDEDFIFYNNLKSVNGEVEHRGDNRTGAGDGDDEIMLIDLMALPYDIASLSFVISIYDAGVREHNFKSVRNCFLRISNPETGIELMRFNLDKEFEENHKATAVTVGTLMREGPNWFFDGVGLLEDGGLPKIATDYGIIVAQ